MALFFYNSKTGIGLADPLSDGKLGEHTTASHFHDYGAGWTHVVSTGGNVFFYHAGKGTARVANVLWLGRYDVVPADSTLDGFSLGWTIIEKVTADTILFYNRATGHAVIGRLADGAFSTVSPTMHLKYGWTHVQPLLGSIFFYDSQLGLAALTQYSEAGATQQGLGDVFEFTSGYTSLATYDGSFLVSPGESWLFAYNKNTGDGAVYTFQDGSLVKTQDYPGAFSKGWDVVVRSERYMFFYRSDGAGAVGRISQGKFATLASYSNLSPGWTHIATPSGQVIDLTPHVPHLP